MMKDKPSNRKSLSLQWAAWLAGLQGRSLVLLLAAWLSLPHIFCPKPSMGLDSAWRQSLQLAVAGKAVFGRDLLFTYGPLGYLLTRSPVSKLNLLLYDFFVMGSLLSVYGKLLPAPMQPARAMLVLALALITKHGLELWPESILFVIAGYWLWCLYARDSCLVPLAGSLAASVLLFFGKVNFGLLMIGLIPSYSFGLLLCRRDWWRAAWLAGGFALLVLIGSACWRVDVGGYLRASLEFISGYNEAMFVPLPARPLAFMAAILLTLGVVAVAFATLRSTGWRDWMMVCPLVILTTWLLFKNAFVRAQPVQMPLFLSSLPLLLALWSLAFQRSRSVHVLLVLSVLCGVVQLEVLGYSLEWFSWTPLRYARGVCVAPWRQNSRQLGDVLRAGWPELTMPAKVRSAIGPSSVEVMPWESPLAILNGLNLKQRPVIQSYAAYTPWLDAQNARFLSSSKASDFILYVTGSSNAIDDRLAAWDESMTKRALMENYIPGQQFQLTQQLFVNRPPEQTPILVLERSAGARDYEPIATNTLTLALDQPLDIPASTNFQFLWLDVERTPRGKLAALLSQAAELAVAFEYSDGTSKDYRAILPILKTGVLINYRVESAGEIRRWLYSDMTGNVTARSLRFKSTSPWAFRSPFHGQVVTCRLVDRRPGGPSGSTGR